MKYLKMLGLAAVAAMALTAFLGAGSASATVLCKTTVTTGCASAGWNYGVGQSIHSVLDSGEEAILNGFWTDVKCKKSTVEGSIGNAGSSTTTVSGNISSITFEECSCAGGATGTAHATTLATGSLEIHSISGSHNGTMTGKDTVVTVDCTSLGTQCRFGSGSSGMHLGTSTSGAPATVDANATVQWTSGTGDEGTFSCGSSAAWEGKYEVTSPNPMYVAES